MPQYELMYLLDSQIVDTEVPAITSQILKFVEDFPMTVTGKAQKFAMRDAMKKELGLEDQRTA